MESESGTSSTASLRLPTQPWSGDACCARVGNRLCTRATSPDPAAGSSSSTGGHACCGPVHQRELLKEKSASAPRASERSSILVEEIELPGSSLVDTWCPTTLAKRTTPRSQNADFGDSRTRSGDNARVRGATGTSVFSPFRGQDCTEFRSRPAPVLVPNIGHKSRAGPARPAGLTRDYH